VFNIYSLLSFGWWANLIYFFVAIFLAWFIPGWLVLRAVGKPSLSLSLSLS
jgi:hypothetical protein